MSWPQETQNPIRVWVSEGGYAFAVDSISITMGLKRGPADASVMRVEEDGHIRYDAVGVGEATNPTIQIPHEFARALLDALLRYYQGASDMHTVRADYLHERGRVDNLIKVVSDIAQHRTH